MVRAAKKGEGAKKNGMRKKGGSPQPPFFERGGARTPGTPLEYAYDIVD